MYRLGEDPLAVKIKHVEYLNTIGGKTRFSSSLVFLTVFKTLVEAATIASLILFDFFSIAKYDLSRVFLN